MSSVFDAHMRLLSVLPVRTVQGRDVADVKAGSQNQKRRIMVGKIEYECVADAARLRRISRAAIYRLVECGKASFLD